MHEVELKSTSIDDLFKFGADFTIIWCFIYQTWEQRLHSEVLPLLRQFSFGDVPVCLLYLNEAENPWLPSGMTYYKETPVLIPFLGGFGVTLVSSPEELEEVARATLEMARRLIQFKKDNPSPL